MPTSSLSFPEDPCHSIPTLSFPPNLVFHTTLSFLFIPNLEIKALSGKFETYLSCDIMISEAGGGFGRRSLAMMTPKPDDDSADLLMAKSKSALMRIPVARLRSFCEAHNLTVSSTGKTGPIKKDYVTAVWFHVSGNIEWQDKTTDKSL
jgi:hypothetical protein